MAIDLRHFDTKTRQDLHLDSRIHHCMAEYLFPKAEFSIGHLEPERAQEADLAPYQGQSLQFSSGQRLYYSTEPVGEQLFPKGSDRAAYGSLPFTPVKELVSLKQARVLVIDDETGNSGGVIFDQERAKELVADCYGKMSYQLAQELTESDNKPVQFRLGIRPQEGNDVHRIAKGTLAPDIRLDRLAGGSTTDSPDPDHLRELNLGQYDLILATSMFKGRKGEDAIKPGSYKLDLGLGLKTEAERGRQKLGVQVLVNYPQGVEKDILPLLKKEADKLHKALDNPASLAETFIEYYENKKSLKESLDAEERYLAPLMDSLMEPEQAGRLSNEEALYRTLKTDLENHGQLLEHPNIVGQLKLFVQTRWKELGFSGGVRIHSALAQPCSKLGENEICAPHLKDGAEVIVTRSPLVNSNGVIVLNNKHIPELMRLKGSIHINPDTAAKHLQADFDGDRLAYAPASDFPNLTAEIKRKLAPDVRYPDIEKRAKVAYQGAFESIAIQCAENQIGTIANQIMRSVAIFNDTLARPDSEKPGVVKQAARYYQRVLSTMEDKDIAIPAIYQNQMKRVVNIVNTNNLHPKNIENALATIRSIQYQAVSDLGNELQVAVDGPKSAARPDLDRFKAVKIASNCIQVAFLKEKNSRDVFLDRPATTSTHSPIDLMLREVNDRFKESTLTIEPRPAHTFRELFPKPSEAYLEKAREIQKNFNDRLSHAMNLADTVAKDPEKAIPHLGLSFNGQAIAVTHIDLGDKSVPRDSPLTVKIKNTPKELNLPHQLSAFADIGGEEKLIGPITVADSNALKLSSDIPPFRSSVTLEPGISASRVEAAWRALDSYTEEIKDIYDNEQKVELAKGLWHVAHARSDYANKKALAAFRVFPEQSLAQLKELQITELKVIGLQYDSNQHRGEDLQGRYLDCEMVTKEIPTKNGSKVMRGVAVEGRFLGSIQQESHGYPVDTIFKARFEPEPPAKAVATLKDGTQLTISKVRDNAFYGVTFNGTQQQLDITPFYDAKRKQQFKVSMGGNTVGFLDSKSATAYKTKLGDREGAITAALASPESNTGTLKVAPDSLRYPWQLDQYKINTDPRHTKELALNAQRDWLRITYDRYVATAQQFNQNFSGEMLDQAVAKLAFLDKHSYNDVAAVISQSPRLTAQRPDDSSPDFPQYREKAVAYIKNVCDHVLEHMNQVRGMER